MRIIFVTPEFLTKNKPTTGLPNYLYRVSKALISMGHVPIIVTSGDKKEHTYYDNIEVFREVTFSEKYKSLELNYIYNAIKSSYQLNKVVNKICKEVKVDIIQYASLYGLAMFQSSKIPSIIRLSSYAKVYYGSLTTYSRNFVNIMSFIERLASKRVSGIIAPSNVMAKEYQRDVNKKVTVIETPFINDSKGMDNSVYVDKIGDSKYLLFFGSLYPEKGILVIADIIHEILNNNPEYIFVFVGKVEVINNINPLKVLYNKAGEYRNRVLYLQPLKHEQLYPIIRNADLVILPSIMENFSNACIEAMYFGRIVIGTEGTSFEQLISNRVNGYLANPNNSQSLLEMINEGLSLSEEAKLQMRIKAKDRIEELKPEYVVKKLLKYYQYIIHKKNHGGPLL